MTKAMSLKILKKNMRNMMKVRNLWGFAAATWLAASPLLAEGFIEYCEKDDKTAEAAHTLKLIEDLTEVTDCKKIKIAMERFDSVGFDSPELVDIEALSFFDNLTAISLRSDKAIKVAPLTKLTQLEGLLLDAPIEEVAVVPTSLKSLHLFRIKSVKISAETSFKNLVELTVYDSGVASYEFLTNAPNLELLAAVNVGLTSLDQVPGHKGLKNLELSFNKLAAVTGIDKFPALTFLELAGNKVTGIEPLGSLPGIEILGLAENPITDLSPLNTLANLKSLRLDGLKLNEVPDLGTKDKLLELSLNNNSLTGISSLTSYPALAEVSVNSNKLTTVAGVEKMANLKKLWLNDNAIKELGQLPKSLREIACEKNGMTSLDWLKGQDLPELTLLNFSHNAIEDLAPLTEHEGIVSLAFTGNKVRSLKGLEALEKLEDVAANKNQIEDITAIAEHPTLETVLLNGNQIKDVSVLGNNGVIRTIELQDNPLGTTIAKTDENCPTSHGPTMLQFWCRIKSLR